LPPFRIGERTPVWVCGRNHRRARVAYPP